jgi:parallel beta-helix repeat protein
MILLAGLLGWMIMEGSSRSATLVVDDDLVQDPAASYRVIQDALNAAYDDDEVVVHPGLYIETIHFLGKDIYLHSVAPGDFQVVRSTVIDAQFAGSVVTFSGFEPPSCRIEGFTLTRGSAESGAGIMGGEGGRPTFAGILRNLIISNTASRQGGGIYLVEGVIENNTIEMNIADTGGGLSLCIGVIPNNLVRDNHARNGGGLDNCGGPVERNTIIMNTAIERGGAFHRCIGEIFGNIIEYNTAAEGGGLVLCGNLVHDNVIRFNSAVLGGGFFRCNRTMASNRVEKNSADFGGAFYDCDGAIESSSIIGNIALNDGGACYDCSGGLLENVLESNRAGNEGGALFRCTGLISQNLVSDNSADRGGGFSRCFGRIRNNRFVSNEATVGGGLYLSSGTLQNSLFQDNSAEQGAACFAWKGTIRQNTFSFNRALNGGRAGAIWMTAGTLVQANIFYGHTGQVLAGPVGFSGAARNRILDNCFYLNQDGVFVEDGPVTDSIVIQSAAELDAMYSWSLDNFDDDPTFVQPAGPDLDPGSVEDNDFHLQSGSVCIDRGTLHALAVIPVHDLDSNSRLSGQNTDTGCYEFDSGPDLDGDGLTDPDEIAAGSNPGFPDTDGDGLIDSLEILRDSSPLELNVGLGLAVPNDYPSIQEAMIMGYHGETILVEPGHYHESILSPGRNLHVRGPPSSV